MIIKNADNESLDIEILFARIGRKFFRECAEYKASSLYFEAP